MGQLLDEGAPVAASVVDPPSVAVVVEPLLSSEHAARRSARRP